MRPVWRAWKALRWNANGWCVTARRCPINGAWRWRCGIRFFFHGYIDICVDIWDIYIFFQKFEIQDFSLVVFVVGKPHFERLVAWQLGLILSATISECVHVKLITWRWHQRKKHMRHVLLLVPRLGEPEPWVNLTNLQMREFSQMMYDG